MTDIDLTPATEPDVHFAIRMAIILDHRGRPKAARAPMSDVDVQIMVDKIVSALRRSNLWPHRRPPTAMHSDSHYKGPAQPALPDHAGTSSSE